MLLVQGHFINFDVSECYTNKLFCNKIWQACKYTRISARNVRSVLAERLSSVTYEDLSVMDRWILSRLSWMVAEVNGALHRNDFHVATSALKQFLYSELCDVYVVSFGSIKSLIYRPVPYFLQPIIVTKLRTHPHSTPTTPGRQVMYIVRCESNTTRFSGNNDLGIFIYFLSLFSQL